jgi:hypothetical protein
MSNLGEKLTEDELNKMSSENSEAILIGLKITTTYASKRQYKGGKEAWLHLKYSLRTSEYR